MDDTQVILTTKQTLFVFSISRETLRRWTEKGCPRIDRGKFDLKAVIQWRDENILGNGNDEMKKARLRREKAKAKHEELITSEMERSLIPRAQAYAWLGQMISESRAVFLQIPYRLMDCLAIESDPKAVFSILKREIYDGLNRLGRGGKKGIPK